MNGIMRKSFAIVFLFTLALSVVTSSAANRVVVIPMDAGAARPQEKSLYIPASAFRPLLGATAWQYEAKGNIINPSSTSWWVAPILLPEDTRITSLELVWKNNAIFTLAQAQMTLQVLSLNTAGIWELYTVLSGQQGNGVHRVESHFDFTVTSIIRPQVAVYLGSTNSWLMGVIVTYWES